MYLVRKAEIADAKVLGRIHSNSWKVAYKGIVPDSVLDNITPEKREKYFERVMSENSEDLFLVYADGKEAGFMTIGRCRDDDRDSTYGEIWGIYLLPEYWNKGIGSYLIDWGINELKSKGYKKVTLWVLEENIKARRFYEKKGFRHDGTVKEIKLGKILNEYRYEKIIT